MKTFFLLATVFGLVSCNTSIGVWRDTKALSSWSVRKVKEARDGTSAAYSGTVDDQEYEYGAPVY